MFLKSMLLIEKFVNNPYVNIAVGLLLLISGISDSVDDYRATGLHFRTHHGIVIFSILNIFKQLPDIFTGLDFINRVNKTGTV